MGGPPNPNHWWNPGFFRFRVRGKRGNSMGPAPKSLEAQNFWTKTAENVTPNPICLDGLFFSNVWLSYLQTKASGHAGESSCQLSDGYYQNLLQRLKCCSSRQTQHISRSEIFDASTILFPEKLILSMYLFTAGPSRIPSAGKVPVSG